MSSAGAQCEHILHVSTQLPYALLVAIVSLVCYFIAGIVKNPIIPLIAGIIILFIILMILKGKPVVVNTEKKTTKVKKR